MQSHYAATTNFEYHKHSHYKVMCRSETVRNAVDEYEQEDVFLRVVTDTDAFLGMVNQLSKFFP